MNGREMLRDKWKTVRAAIDEDIASGKFAQGDRIPTETELAEIYGAGRHSVRRAVAELAKEGKLSVEQGRGTYVEAMPRIVYAIGKRTRVHRNLLPQGIKVTGELLDAEMSDPSDGIRQVLGLEDGEPAISSRRITYADGLPIGFGVSWRSSIRFPDFVERQSLLLSATETYKTYGITDYFRAETTIESRPARPEEAELLRQHPDMPVMILHSLDTLTDGTPICYSETVWSTARVRFTISATNDA